MGESLEGIEYCSKSGDSSCIVKSIRAGKFKDPKIWKWVRNQLDLLEKRLNLGLSRAVTIGTLVELDCILPPKKLISSKCPKEIKHAIKRARKNGAYESLAEYRSDTFLVKSEKPPIVCTPDDGSFVMIISSDGAETVDTPEGMSSADTLFKDFHGKKPNVTKAFAIENFKTIFFAGWVENIVYRVPEGEEDYEGFVSARHGTPFIHEFTDTGTKVKNTQLPCISLTGFSGSSLEPRIAIISLNPGEKGKETVFVGDRGIIG